ncbi:hypothetical protein EGW08_008337, partial [Elysia chlorotica]
MACDLPCMSYMALYVISMHLVNSSSRSGASTSSQHWKLNVSAGKVEPAKASPGTHNDTNSDSTDHYGSNHKDISDSSHYENHLQLHPSENRSESTSSSDSDSDSAVYNDIDIDLRNREVYSDDLYEDRMLQILNSKSGSGKEWIVFAPSDEDEECGADHLCSHESSRGSNSPRSSSSKSSEDLNSKSHTEKSGKSKSQKPLTCGKKVNSTAYDHLKGISERHLHSHIPEPDVAVVFQSIGKSAEVDINDLEQKLRKTRRDVEKAGPEQ